MQLQEKLMISAAIALIIALTIGLIYMTYRLFFTKKKDESESLEDKIQKQTRILNLQEQGLDAFESVQKKWKILGGSITGAKGKAYNFFIATVTASVISFICLVILSTILDKVGNLSMLKKGLETFPDGFLWIKYLYIIAIFSLVYAYFRNFVYMANSDKEKKGTGIFWFHIFFLSSWFMLGNFIFIGIYSIKNTIIFGASFTFSALLLLGIAIFYLKEGWIMHQDSRGVKVSGVPQNHIAVIECFSKWAGMKDPGPGLTVPFLHTYINVPLMQQKINCLIGKNTEESQLSINGSIDTERIHRIAGEVEIRELAVGLDWSFFFEIQKDVAQKSVYGTTDYYDYLIDRVSSALRSFLSFYTFEEVNKMRGSTILPFILKGSHPDGSRFELKEMAKMLSDEELIEELNNCPLYQDILKDVGTRITTISINDISLPKEMSDSRDRIFAKKQELAQAEIGIQIANAKARQVVEESLGEKQAIINKQEGISLGFQSKINGVVKTAKVQGNTALAFINTESRSSAIENGANATLIEGGDSNIGNNVLAGVGVGAGFQGYRKKRKPRPPYNKGDQGNNQNKT